MVTTRRSTRETAGGAFATGVGVLERPASYEEYVTAPEKEKCTSAEEQHRRANLEKLLNYDRYSEQVEVEEKAVEAPVQDLIMSLADEDIRPTSTTMQFGEDLDQIRHEMNHKKEEVSVKHGLNSRGRLAVTLYALVVTVILALIVLNTGVLAKLTDLNQAKAAELEATITQYNAIQDEIASISDSEYVMSVAQEQYGMIKR